MVGVEVAEGSGRGEQEEREEMNPREGSARERDERLKGFVWHWFIVVKVDRAFKRDARLSFAARTDRAVPSKFDITLFMTLT